MCLFDMEIYGFDDLFFKVVTFVMIEVALVTVGLCGVAGCLEGSMTLRICSRGCVRRAVCEKGHPRG
jgi:hypothetical protein